MKTEEPGTDVQRRSASTPDRPVALLVVIFTVEAGKLQVLLIRRSAPPHQDDWSLPGGLLAEGRSLADAVTRRLEIETGVHDVFLAQLYTFSALAERDSVAVAYWALVDKGSAQLARRDEWQPAWHHVDELPELAFKNAMVVEYALARLRNKLAYSNVAYSLLPPEFTLSQLQQSYEAILGRALDKRNFRKRITSLGIVEATGRYESEGRHRPAQLYRFLERRPVVV
ncbi:MAG TPA: NUDIX domain-containing protein [Dehalococcoidia bacterium]